MNARGEDPLLVNGPKRTQIQLQVVEFPAAYRDQKAADALRLLMLTGARESEVLKAEWAQFDLERGIWTKPSHHTKQKRIEHVPLSSAALQLLRTMKPKKATGPLFESADGAGTRVTLRCPWVQVCKAAGLVDVETHNGKRRKVVHKYRPTLRIHDLRHTYASHLVSKGTSLQIVGNCLDTRSPRLLGDMRTLQMKLNGKRPTFLGRLSELIASNAS